MPNLTEESNVWYQEGVGYIDEQWQHLIGLPLSFSIRRIVQQPEQTELSQWRQVRNHLANGEDIMEIEVPHENYQGDPYLPLRPLSLSGLLSKNIIVTRSRGFGHESDSSELHIKPQLLGAEMLEIIREQDWGNGIALHIDTASYGHSPADESETDAFQQSRAFYKGHIIDPGQANNQEEILPPTPES